jgi:tape measure domain-containing protein
MLNLGQVQFGLGVDTRSLNAAVGRVQAFGRAVEQASAQQGQAAQRVATAMRRQESAVTSALQQILRMNDQIRRSTRGNEQTQLLNQTRNAFIQLEAQLARGPRAVLAYQRANESFAASLGTVQRRMAELRAEEARRRQGQTAFGTLLRDLASASVLALGPLSGLGARIAALGAVAQRSSFGLAALIGAVVAVGTGLAKLSSAAVRTALDIQRIEARLISTTGSVDLANFEFDRLKELANDTGLEFVGLATQFTRFQAAAQGTSLEGDRAREVFDNLAFAVGNFQLEATAAEGVFRAVEQIMSKGTVAAEEIRQQLGDRLPGAFKAAADAIGVTTEEFNKLLKRGKIASDEFLLPFSRQVRQRLAGDAVGAVDSLRASINRLLNSVTFFNDSFDNAFGISNTFRFGVETLTSAINFLGRNILAVTAIIGGLTGGLALMALPRIIAGFTFLAGALRTATFAFIGLNAAIVASPLGRLVTVAIRLIAIIGGAALAVANFGSSTAQAATNEAEMAVKTDMLIESQEQLNTTVGESASIFKKAAVAKLEAIKLELEGVELQLQSYRSVLAEQLKQNEALAVMHRNSQEFISAMRSASGEITSPRDVGTAGEEALKGRILDLNTALDAQRERIKKLDEIKNGTGNRNFAEGTDRATKAVREATQAIDDLLKRNEAMMQGPQAFEAIERQIEMNKKIQDFKDRLVDAEVPLDTIREKINQYTFALQLHEEISDGVFKNMAHTYETFKGIAVDAFQSVGDALASAIVEGELSAETFVNIFKDMAKKIIAEVIRLAIINNILNSLFGLSGGSALPTFAFSGPGLAKGGAFSGGTRFLAKGGILDSPTAFGTSSGMAVGGEAGSEAVLPLTRTASGNLGVEASGASGAKVDVNIYNNSGEQVKTERRKGTGGRDIIDVVIGAVKGEMAKGSFDTSMGRYGLSPVRRRV